MAAPPRQHPRRRGAGIVMRRRRFARAVPRRSACSPRWSRWRRAAGARRRGAGARAGRSKGRSSARRPATPDAGEPLWEVGIGVAAVRFPDYRGSDQSSTYVLPLPVRRLSRPLPARRPRRRARDPVRRPARAGRPEPLGVGAERGARTTTRAAACPTCPARSRSARTRTSSCGNRPTGASSSTCACRCARRSRCSRSPRAIGVTFSPNLNLDVRGFAESWNVGLLAGPLFADRRYHEHFYGVAPEFASAVAARPTTHRAATPAGARRPRSRAGSATPGSAASFATTTCTAPRSRASPLVRRESNVTAGFGISWIFATSSQRVRTDD